MKKSAYRPFFAIGAAFLAVACAKPGTGISTGEDMLVAAGFVPKHADSPSRMAALKSLPPHEFVSRNRNGGVVYLYADPTVCACIYVGNQQAYDRYRQQMAARQTVEDNRIRAILSTTPLPGEAGL
jgi:hypothetical protein